MKFAIPAAVAVLAAATAVASRTSATGPPPSVNAPSGRPVLVLFALVGAALVVASLAAGIAVRGGRPTARGRPRLLARMVAVVLPVIALLALARVVTGGGLPEPPAEEEEEVPAETVPDDGTAVDALEGARGGLAGLAAGGVIVAIGVWIFVRRRPSQGEDLTADLRAALQRGIDDLRAATDARAAVISAYARVEAVLEAASRGRLRPETTVEYVHRVLAESDVPDEPLLTLGALYQHARYAGATVDRHMQLEAVDALVAVRDALAAVAPGAVSGGVSR